MAQEYRIIRITTNNFSGITDSNREDVVASGATLSLSGLTVLDDLNVDGNIISNGLESSFNSLTAVTISATTIYSGSTDLYDIFLTADRDWETA